MHMIENTLVWFQLNLCGLIEALWSDSDCHDTIRNNGVTFPKSAGLLSSLLLSSKCGAARAVIVVC